MSNPNNFRTKSAIPNSTPGSKRNFKSPFSYKKKSTTKHTIENESYDQLIQSYSYQFKQQYKNSINYSNMALNNIGKKKDI